MSSRAHGSEDELARLALAEGRAGNGGPEAGSKKRASLHLVEGEEARGGHDPGGLEVQGADLEAFRRAITA